MIETVEQYSYFEFFLFVVVVISMRYLIIAGPLFLLLWVWNPRILRKYKIQTDGRVKPVPLVEFLYSISTILINGIFGIFLFYLYKHNYLQIYTEANSTFDYLYMGASVFLAMLFHDAYFYWSHRWMHSDFLYRTVHSVHHKSLNPTPLSSYCFHPIEAFMEVFFLLPLLALLPMHPSAIFAFLLLTFFFNVQGHTGFEFLPKWVWRTGLTTPTHHNLHHRRFNCNYALYGRIWDEWFGTLYEGTEAEFKKNR